MAHPYAKESKAQRAKAYQNGGAVHPYQSGLAGALGAIGKAAFDKGVKQYSPPKAPSAPAAGSADAERQRIMDKMSGGK